MIRRVHITYLRPGAIFKRLGVNEADPMSHMFFEVLRTPLPSSDLSFQSVSPIYLVKATNYPGIGTMYNNLYLGATRNLYGAPAGVINNNRVDCEKFDYYNNLRANREPLSFRGPYVNMSNLTSDIPSGLLLGL